MWRWWWTGSEIYCPLCLSPYCTLKPVFHIHISTPVHFRVAVEFEVLGDSVGRGGWGGSNMMRVCVREGGLPSRGVLTTCGSLWSPRLLDWPSAMPVYKEVEKMVPLKQHQSLLQCILGYLLVLNVSQLKQLCITRLQLLWIASQAWKGLHTIRSFACTPQQTKTNRLTARPQQPAV